MLLRFLKISFSPGKLLISLAILALPLLAGGSTPAPLQSTAVAACGQTVTSNCVLTPSLPEASAPTQTLYITH